MNKGADFYKKLLTVVVPIAFQNFMSAAVSASDAIMLGFIDQDSLSAVSLAGQIQFVLSLFQAALVIGTTIFASQYWGKEDVQSIEKMLGTILKVSLAVSALFWCGATFSPAVLMQIFTKDRILIAKGTEYLRAVALSYLFMAVSQIYLSVMKSCGKALKSTVIGSVSMVLNIILNAILIFGTPFSPALGIAGAAIATVISRAIELLWCGVESFKKDNVRIRVKYMVHESRLLRHDFFKYTMPVVGNELVWGCAFTMYSVIMGHLGNDAVAANAIANIAKNLIACVCLGVGSGGGILVGNELGREAIAKAKDYGRRLCRISIISGVISGIVLLGMIPVILSIVELTPVAQGYLKGMLLMCSYYMVGKSVNSATIAGIFCAGGDSKFGLFCDSVVMWLVILPVAFLAAFYWKVSVLAVYFIINLDEMVKLPAVYIHYKKYKWLKVLTRESKNNY